MTLTLLMIAFRLLSTPWWAPVAVVLMLRTGGGGAGRGSRPGVADYGPNPTAR
jgi:hypothetical protein